MTEAVPLKLCLVNSDSFVLARLIIELDPEYTFF